MWFVSQGTASSVSRIDTAGQVLTKDLASAIANPTHITAGPEGALWFTEGVTKAIGRIPAAVPLAVPDESRLTSEAPNAIAAGSDGNLWFTEYSVSMIGRMTPAGVATYFPLPPGLENPEGITAGPDGALWYTTLNPSAIVRIATDGSQRTFPVPKEKYRQRNRDRARRGAVVLCERRNRSDDHRRRTGILLAAERRRAQRPRSGPRRERLVHRENVGQIGRITTPPNATTGASGGLAAGQATITGVVNGHSQPTEVRIEYGPASSPTTTSAPLHLPALATDQPISISLSRLTPKTVYRRRVVATNATGSTAGAFTRSPLGRLRNVGSRNRSWGGRGP